MPSIDDIAVLTSENVRLTYSLAGLGSRTAAYLIDKAIIGLVVAGITLLFISFGMSFEALDYMMGGSVATSFLMGLYIFVVAIVFWGYYFLFEWMNWGQTPGKQTMGIRVSMADGAPADLVACAVRNVIRFLDEVLAAFGITFLLMIFTPRFQRLGDLAAGTVVVKRRKLRFEEVMSAAVSAEKARAQLATEPAMQAVTLRIDDAEINVIAKFLERRDTLPLHVRTELGRDLAGRLRSKMGADTGTEMSDEDLLMTALNQARKRAAGGV